MYPNTRLRSGRRPPPLLTLDSGPHAWLQDRPCPWHSHRHHLAAEVLGNPQVEVEGKLAALRVYYQRWGSAETVAALRLAHRLGPLDPQLADVLRDLTRPSEAA